MPPSTCILPSQVQSTGKEPDSLCEIDTHMHAEMLAKR